MTKDDYDSLKNLITTVLADGTVTSWELVEIVKRLIWEFFDND